MCVQLDADVRVINGNRCECVFVNSAWKGIAEVEHPLVALEGNPAEHSHTCDEFAIPSCFFTALYLTLDNSYATVISSESLFSAT